jgi:hypothetical protein
MRLQQLRIFQNLHRQPIRDNSPFSHHDRAREEFLHQRHIVRGHELRLPGARGETCGKFTLKTKSASELSGAL